MIRALSSALLALFALLMLALPAQAVPEASHVRISCALLRLNLNNAVLRHQIKLTVSVTRSEESELDGLENSFMKVANPQGTVVRMAPLTVKRSPKRFKAATTALLFKASDDTADAAETNVPEGFFDTLGPFVIELWIDGQRYRGAASFNEQIEMHAEQDGATVRNCTLRDEAPLYIRTVPEEFGPVYYKKQDFTNFFFQLANMDNALTGESYHAPRDNPLYVLQVRVSDGDGGPSRLLDPSRYIRGFEEHMIRSERTATPIEFAADEFSAGEVAVVDFVRQESFAPDTIFSGPGDFSCDVVIRERIVFALGVESPPLAGELLSTVTED